MKPISVGLLFAITSCVPGISGYAGTFVEKRADGLADPAGLSKYGFTGVISDPIHRPSYIGAYDRRSRNPYWIAEHITAESLAKSTGDPSAAQYHEDTTIPELFRALLKDYARSGYDHGNMMPVSDGRWDQEATNEIFTLSNMCPQVGKGFNRGYWAEFEKFCRGLTKVYSSVRIVTGPLYMPIQEGSKWVMKYEIIGNPPNVAVPTHFFKVIFAEGKGEAVALGSFVLPNKAIDNSTPLESFHTPLEAIEKASGLVFASDLERNQGHVKPLCSEVECKIGG
ncbi:uncharacterized protein GIQ15_05765 [Arthroderma uncinatum]|uniref:uncharacterized protein n=1 Tax=Arthroderma uncinatum TaxID=74035 RepID=UPI00144AD5E8|nr:uncharacterized protein GIQ15_05765 [Arthroderma uncinatum]KAF3480418.1 hypothetical protein GIQ15_05765 [Arthroderma uncinatum]